MSVIDLNGKGSSPRPSFRAIALVVLALLGLGFINSMVFTIAPEEEGVVLRFGEYDRTVAPGLQFKLPSPIEQVWKIPTQRQLKEEFGFRTLRAGQRTRYSDVDFSEEKLMLTGDLNVASVEWIAQYRIKDPYKHIFKVRNVQSTFRDMNEAIMREIIGDRSVTEVLTIGRQEIEALAEEKLQIMCDEYETGIKVEQVVLQNVNPPDPVKPSFDEVNQAQQERERLINDAKTSFNKVIPAARGEAEQTIAQARGYAVQRLNKAKGEAARFAALREAYREAPQVTRKRLYLETIGEVIPKVENKIIVSEDAQGVLPLLQLNGGN